MTFVLDNFSLVIPKGFVSAGQESANGSCPTYSHLGPNTSQPSNERIPRRFSTSKDAECGLPDLLYQIHC